MSALDPSFRAQELSFVVEQVATNIEFAAAAERRTWLDAAARPPARRVHRPARRRPASGPEPTPSATRRGCTTACAAPSALGLAVLVADLTSVQHGFWVVFGTLSVLRSNALSTGQNMLRALLGTTAGFVVGGALVALIGTNTDAAVGAAAVAVLFAGLAPAAISFAAGQAAFTMTLLILFNLLAPAGWQVGLVRVEDVAIGGAVSLASGCCCGRAAPPPRSAGRSPRPTPTASATWPAPSPTGSAAATPAGRGRAAPPTEALHARPPPRAGSTTPSAATWPSAAPSRCRWPR